MSLVKLLVHIGPTCYYLLLLVITLYFSIFNDKDVNNQTCIHLMKHVIVIKQKRL